MNFSLKHPDLRLLALLAMLYSTAALSAALVMQYGFGLHPCELCMAQRYPYAAAAIIGLATYIAAKSPRALFLGVLFCALLLALDAGIAFYHAGVEAGIFPGPSGCTNSGGQGETIEEMRAAIMNAPLVPCDQPMARFLGLSIAAWNGIAAAAVSLYLFSRIPGARRRAGT